MDSRYMNQVARFGFVLLLLSLCWGCATPQETANLQQSINVLFDRVQKLESRVQGTGQEEQRLAELYARLDELQMKVGSLNGRVEEQQRALDRLTSAPSTAPPAPFSPSSAAPASAVPGAARPPGPEPKIVIQEEKNPEKAMYNNALQLYQQGRFDQARKEAQGFLAKYSQSDLVDNAQFLVGECYYSEKRYKEAIESYQQVMDKYPKGNKVSSALLKQASAFKELGDATAARILYERLLESYPGTPQAQQAERELKQLR